MWYQISETYVRPHVHMNLKNYLESQKTTEMGHPSYSQDITLCYFCLFDFIMQRLSIHSGNEVLSGQITEIVISIPKYGYDIERYLISSER